MLWNKVFVCKLTNPNMAIDCRFIVPTAVYYIPTEHIQGARGYIFVT